MTDIAVACKQVSKRYGAKTALDHLDITIPRGHVVGVLGPNGAGKSTFFRMLAGLVQPDAGVVEVLGQRPGWRANENIAYLPDRARWYPDHTTEQAFQWAERFLPAFDRAVAERLASLMQLDLTLQAGGMSRGQEARLMLILCVARRVPLIILDEPFSGIDVVSREQIVDALMEHICDGDKTVLISTHEIHEVEALFDSVIFLGDGRLQLAGEADALRRQYGSMREIVKRLHLGGEQQ
ncbi:ABC transporter ATP-binding protein [Alicyclobacillus contaminans]|uniref:ABC transporter ATP-binding protein n=1 Tax=Alicyclobacillus contaminans TaxID=392016 RepID=UPI0003FFD0BA|nr:ABC transporter ATP-binding protein [Alicyclobacillus contaminans]